MNTLPETISALAAETGHYSSATRFWMMGMAFTFTLSLVFVWFRYEARWILAAFLINVSGIIMTKWLVPDLTRSEIGTVIHLIFWPIALVMILRSLFGTRRQTRSGAFQVIYLTWLTAACLIMTLSIILDARTFLGWIT